MAVNALGRIREWFFGWSSTTPVSQSGTAEEEQFAGNLKRTARVLNRLTYAGLLGLIMVAFGGGYKADGLLIKAVGAVVLVAGAPGLIGAIIGFVFGIPQAVQRSPAAPNNTEPSDRGGSGVEYRVNSNLDQISEWLTKIIVGVGLTEVNNIPSGLRSLGQTLGPLVGDSEPAAIVGVLYFAATGFFSGYLLTRLYLAPLFKQADDALRRQVRAQQTVTEGLVRDLLYQAPPEGFEQAIKNGELLISQRPQWLSSAFWRYMACAYGQKYAWERTRGNREAGDEVTQELKQKALQAARRAISINSLERDVMRQFYDPQRYGSNPDDDDLRQFAVDEDADFRKLLALG